MTSPQAATVPGLSRDRDFWLFATGQGISAVGDSLTQIALPLVVLTLTGSGAQMGLVAMLITLPMLLLGLPAGALADRWDRRRMMLYADVGRAVLLAMLPLAVFTDVPVMPVIYAVCVPLGVMRVLFEAACLSCVPALVGRERLAQANAALSAVNAVGFLIGPSLAGLLVVTIGGPTTLGFDALTFAVSAVTLWFIRRPLQRATHEVVVGRVGSQVRDGLRFIARTGRLRLVLGYWALLTFLVAPLVTSTTYLAQKDLGWAPQTLGILLTVYAAGSIAGALAAPVFMARPFVSLYASGALGAAAIVAIAWSGSLGLVFTLAVIAGAGEGMASVTYATMRADLTPDELLGRVTTTAQVVTNGLRSASLGLAGLALDLWSGRGTLTAIGVGCLALTVAFGVLTALHVSRSPRTVAGPTPAPTDPTDPASPRDNEVTHV